MGVIVVKTHSNRFLKRPDSDEFLQVPVDDSRPGFDTQGEQSTIHGSRTTQLGRDCSFEVYYERIKLSLTKLIFG